MDRLAAILASYKPTCVAVNLHKVGSAKLAMGTVPASNARLCLVRQGHISWQSEQDTLQIQSGDLLWVSANVEGDFSSSQADAELVVCELACGLNQQNPVLARMPPQVLVPEKQHDASQSLAPVISLMLQEASNPECGQSQVQTRLAEVLLIRVLRYFMRNAILNVGIIGALGDTRLARALTAIHEAPGAQWTVESLAEIAGMSRTAFSNKFRDIVGHPPMSYLTDWRMRLACIWIRERQGSIGSIADRLGYRSETAFRRAFKQTLGHPPGGLRETLDGLSGAK